MTTTTSEDLPTTKHGEAKDDPKMPPSPLRRASRLAARALLLLPLASVSAVLLVGHVVYPSSPLLPPGGPSASRSNDDGAFSSADRLSLATLSFAAATSLRTAVLAPLLRLRGGADAGSWLSAAVDKMDLAAGRMERFAHGAWEDVARRSGVLREDGPPPPSSYREPPEVDLDAAVPCERELAREHLLGGGPSKDDRHDGKAADDSICRLRDVITRQLLVERVKASHDGSFELATHPLVLRNVWPSGSFDASCTDDGCHRRRRLTPGSILSDPQLSNLLLPNYFSDATRAGYDALVPDRNQTTLSQFVTGILSGETPHAKIGTQVIVEQVPELRDELFPPGLAKELFGWSTWPEDLKKRARDRWGPHVGGWIDKLPGASQFPVFVAGNRRGPAAPHPRTDLHAEPIGNVASQLHGARRWTLVPARWTGLLRPAASRRRGFFYSALDPTAELPGRLGGVPDVYECVTRRGDAVWIPPWMWHRVDYDGGVGRGEESESTAATAPYENLSIGASIFHFYPRLYVTNLPLFSFLIVPNLIQEVLGFNTE